MERHEALARLTSAPVARLATLRPGGAPHLVPITFAVVSEHIVTAVDAKPKATRHLARLGNIAADPRVAVLADHYADDWSTLWWVRADGIATVTGHPSEVLAAALIAKYAPYRDHPPLGPWIVIEVSRVSGWSASG